MELNPPRGFCDQSATAADLRSRAAVLAVILLVPPFAPTPALAWNHKAHMAIASIAYAQLSPDERTAVFRALEAHPDIETLSRLAGSQRRGEYRERLFLHASRWPDLIRDDPRFYDETDSGARPTPPLPDYPDMKKHKPWHFRNAAFSDDGTSTAAPDHVNALSAIRAFRPVIAREHGNPGHKAYALSWLAHLVGDVHQPLHCATRVTREHPGGDRGGNLFEISPYRVREVTPDPDNLHSFWDAVLGADTRLSAVGALARDAERTRPAERADVVDEEIWARESFEYARTFAYARLLGHGQTPRITLAYYDEARALALTRVKLAGLRLAAVIRRDLK